MPIFVDRDCVESISYAPLSAGIAIESLRIGETFLHLNDELSLFQPYGKLSTFLTKGLILRLSKCGTTTLPHRI